MLTMILVFLAGMVVMDVMWALKLRIPQMMYYRWKHRNDPKPQYEDYDYGYDGEAK